MILYLETGGNHNNFFLENLKENSISIATLVKQLLKALAISDGLVIASLLTVIAVGEIWLKLFEDIIFCVPFHMFLGLFLKKSGKVKSVSFFFLIVLIN